MSPPKVVINQPSDPGWLHYGVPTLGILLAFLAALFAYLSWERMRLQINLAEKQIDLALRDLEITTRQAALADDERTKAPNVAVSLSFTKATEDLDANGLFGSNFDVYVTNVGTAPANNIEVLLQFPHDAVTQSEDELAGIRLGRALAVRAPGYRVDDNIMDDIILSPMVDSFGNRWATVFNRNLELLPGQRPWKIGHGGFRVRPGRTKMLWRVKCRQGDFPGGNGDNELPLVLE